MRENNSSKGRGATRPFASVLVIGVGLIGGSVAAACKALPERQRPQVRGIDTDPKALQAALEKGFLDEGAVPHDAHVNAWLGEGVTPSDLIVLAVPASEATAWFERIEAAIFQGVLTDVASTKGMLTAEARRVLSTPQRYIPGHPMAGSEVNGIEGARATLFSGAHWILCPDATSDPDSFTRLHEFVTSLGARSISLPREEHDDAMAIVSHVPHLVASALVQLAGTHASERQEIFRLAAGGFKDTTRIAAGSPELWSGIALDNREALARGLAEMGHIIESFEQAVSRGDARALTGLLADAARLRRSIPATWVPSSERLVEIRIPMANRAGVIAQVTGFAGKAGCNIQSIDIDHINEATAILELILTDEGDLGGFTSQLIENGFDVALRPLSPATP
jgi:prephenate dehydrogenase